MERLAGAVLSGSIGALLTAFYMTRQVCYVFFGKRRKDPAPDPIAPSETAVSDPHDAAHESPAAMTAPLVLLALFAVLLGFIGTPAWPWLQAFLEMRSAGLDFRQLMEDGLPQLMLASSLLVFAGLGLGWWIYGRKPIKRAADADALERLQPAVFHALRQGLYVDQLYALTIQRLAWWIAIAAELAGTMGLERHPDRCVRLTKGIGWIDFSLDRWVVNKGFDEGMQRRSGWRPAAGALAGWTHPKLSAVGGSRGGSAGPLSAAGTQGMSSFPFHQPADPASLRRSARGAAAGPGQPGGGAPGGRDLRHRRGCVYGACCGPLPACAVQGMQFQEWHAWEPSIGLAVPRRPRRPEPGDAGCLLDRRAHVDRGFLE
jgi:hypothetical protein